MNLDINLNTVNTESCLINNNDIPTKDDENFYELFGMKGRFQKNNWGMKAEYDDFYQVQSMMLLKDKKLTGNQNKNTNNENVLNFNNMQNNIKNECQKFGKRYVRNIFKFNKDFVPKTILKKYKKSEDEEEKANVSYFPYHVEAWKSNKKSVISKNRLSYGLFIKNYNEEYHSNYCKDNINAEKLIYETKKSENNKNYKNVLKYKNKFEIYNNKGKNRDEKFLEDKLNENSKKHSRKSSVKENDKVVNPNNFEKLNFVSSNRSINNIQKKNSNVTGSQMNSYKKEKTENFDINNSDIRLNIPELFKNTPVNKYERLDIKSLYQGNSIFNRSDSKNYLEKIVSGSGDLKFIHVENDKNIKKMITSNIFKLMNGFDYLEDLNEGPNIKIKHPTLEIEKESFNKFRSDKSTENLDLKKDQINKNTEKSTTIIGIENQVVLKNLNINEGEEEKKNYNILLNKNIDLRLINKISNAICKKTLIIDESKDIMHSSICKKSKLERASFLKLQSLKVNNHLLSNKIAFKNSVENKNDKILDPMLNKNFNIFENKNSIFINKDLIPDLKKFEQIENQEGKNENLINNNGILKNQASNIYNKSPIEIERATENIKTNSNVNNLKSRQKDSNVINPNLTIDKTASDSDKDLEEPDIYKFRFITKRKNVYDSLSEDEEKIKYSSPNKFYFNPNSYWKLFLEFMNFLIVLYSTFFLPLKLIYYTDFCVLRFSIELVFDLVMVIDFFLGFFTAYFDFEENFITSCEKTVLNYFQTYFFIDILASIPFNSVMEYFEFTQIKNELLTDNYFSQPKLKVENFLDFDQAGVFYQILIFENFGKVRKIFQLFRASKAFKVFSHNVFLNKLLDYFITDFSFLQINVKLFSYYLYFFIISHILSCMFIFLGTVDYPNWIVHSNLQDSSFSKIYLASLYFNHTTIFTVGYGDILSNNKFERTYNIILMIVGIMLYSFALTSISNIIKNNNEKNKDYENKKEYLNHISTKYIINKELYSKLSRHLSYQKKVDKSNKIEFLNQLPISLRNELILGMHKNMIQTMNFFKECYDNDFIIQVIISIKPTTSVKKEILIKQGDFIEEIILVKNGIIEFETVLKFEKYNLSKSTSSQENSFDLLEDQVFTENLKILDLRKNEHFGDSLMIDNLRSPLTLKTKTKSADIFLLRKLDVMKLSDEFQSVFEKIYEKSSINLQRIIEKIKNITNEKIKQNIQAKKYNKSSMKKADGKKIINKINFLNHENNYNLANLIRFESQSIDRDEKNYLEEKMKISENSKRIIRDTDISNITNIRKSYSERSKYKVDNYDYEKYFNDTKRYSNDEKLIESSNRRLLNKDNKCSVIEPSKRQIYGKCYLIPSNERSGSISIFSKESNFNKPLINNNIISSGNNSNYYNLNNLTPNIITQRTFLNYSNNHKDKSKIITEELSIPNEFSYLGDNINISKNTIPDIMPRLLTMKNRSLKEPSLVNKENFENSVNSLYENSLTKRKKNQRQIKGPVYSEFFLYNTSNKLDTLQEKEIDIINTYPKSFDDSNSSISIDMNREFVSSKEKNGSINNNHRNINMDKTEKVKLLCEEISRMNFSDNVSLSDKKWKNPCLIKDKNERIYLCSKCHNIISTNLKLMDKKKFDEYNIDYSIEKVNSLCILGSTEESSIEKTKAIFQQKKQKVNITNKNKNFNIHENKININNIHINKNNNHFSIDIDNSQSKNILQIKKQKRDSKKHQQKNAYYCERQIKNDNLTLKSQEILNKSEIYFSDDNESNINHKCKLLRNSILDVSKDIKKSSFKINENILYPHFKNLEEKKKRKDTKPISSNLNKEKIRRFSELKNLNIFQNFLSNHDILSPIKNRNKNSLSQKFLKKKANDNSENLPRNLTRKVNIKKNHDGGSIQKKKFNLNILSCKYSDESIFSTPRSIYQSKNSIKNKGIIKQTKTFQPNMITENKTKNEIKYSFPNKINKKDKKIINKDHVSTLKKLNNTRRNSVQNNLIHNQLKKSFKVDDYQVGNKINLEENHIVKKLDKILNILNI